jgi:hypothetical protein
MLLHCFCYCAVPTLPEDCRMPQNHLMLNPRLLLCCRALLNEPSIVAAAATLIANQIMSGNFHVPPMMGGHPGGPGPGPDGFGGFFGPGHMGPNMHGGGGPWGGAPEGPYGGPMPPNGDPYAPYGGFQGGPGQGAPYGMPPGPDAGWGQQAPPHSTSSLGAAHA